MPVEKSGVRTELVRLAASSSPAAEPARAALGEGSESARLRAAILALAQHRAPAGSTCPSDAARAVGGERWRELMQQTRDIAISLARSGQVVLTQRGDVLDPDATWRGPIRITALSN